MRPTHLWSLGIPPLLLAGALASGCSGGETAGTAGSAGSTTDTGGSAGTAGAGGDSGSGGSTGSGTTSTTGNSECAGLSTNIERVVCAAEAFLATLSSDEQDTVLYDFTDSVAKTRWSNLPGVQRSGIQLGALTADQRTAALAVAAEVLSDAGYTDLIGVLAADDYLGTQGGGGPGGGYSSDYYSIAFIGAPSTTGDWMFQLGGHHMAWNVTYLAGVGYPTPAHLGVEPKSSFTIDGGSHEPMTPEGAALVAMFSALSATELSSAYLSGQQFADVLLGPDEYGTGSYANVVFPTGANRKGVLVSSLTAAQQALVTAAIEEWVSDYDPEVADALVAEYTSASAYSDTLIAWAGTEAQGVDPDVNGTYMRIDGPRVWIEVACQGGVIIAGQTHYHSIFRDKEMDYGSSL